MLNNRLERVEIGDGNGKIVLFLNETSAIDLAQLYGPSDGAYDELMQAVERAYPETAPGRQGRS